MYKRQRKHTWGPTAALWSQLFLEAAINPFITGPISAYFLFQPLRSIGMPSAADPLPSVLSVAVLLAGAHLTNDCLLYSSPSPRDRQKFRLPFSA